MTQTKQPYYIWTVGDKALKLRLTNKNIIDLEKEYEGNLFKLLNDIPPLHVMLNIITKASERFNHGETKDSISEFYEEYVDNGGSQLELFTVVIMGVFGVSGFFSEKMKTEMSSKLQEVAETI
ncbi:MULTISPECIES: DUF6096 family protein [unclassified Granulicatella]|uniref:DUF6096 family protein n=1 Tax=unclassified Granulicatella TaxID=2630493 RepID=UPI0010738C32|nr:MULTISPECIES: DUF6096 family protein [unclassified Granulicatella]MBF0779796.1 hypothetical protein [Granulicatella sp. 19428wC4_WM01]TFU96198.1 hypothetical protein E4T68_01690 [Granulicatella sp. WM01]